MSGRRQGPPMYSLDTACSQRPLRSLDPVLCPPRPRVSLGARHRARQPHSLCSFQMSAPARPCVVCAAPVAKYKCAKCREPLYVCPPFASSSTPPAANRAISGAGSRAAARSHATKCTRVRDRPGPCRPAGPRRRAFVLRRGGREEGRGHTDTQCGQADVAAAAAAAAAAAGAAPAITGKDDVEGHAAPLAPVTHDAAAAASAGGPAAGPLTADDLARIGPLSPRRGHGSTRSAA